MLKLSQWSSKCGNQIVSLAQLEAAQVVRSWNRGGRIRSVNIREIGAQKYGLCSFRNKFLKNPQVMVA